MSTGCPSRSRRPLPLLAALCLAWGAPVPATADEGAAPAPTRVARSLSIRASDWAPLDADALGRAIAVATRTRLEELGGIRVVEAKEAGEPAAPTGRLALVLERDRDREVAELTLTLERPASADRAVRPLVTRASIALDAVDPEALGGALEHLGRSAAERLVARHEAGPDGATHGDTSGAPLSRRERLEAGRADKQAGRLTAARRAFAAVAGPGDAPADTLGRLAEDELRYGLPLYATQQALNELGRLELATRSPRRAALLARAEHLLRQIRAENAAEPARTIEARRALTHLAKAREGLGASPRASLLLRMQALRIAMVDFAHSVGRCPEVDWIEDTARRMRTHVSLDEITFEGDHARRYVFHAPASRTRVALRCSDDGIEMVESGDGISDFPAALPGGLPPGLPLTAPSDASTETR
jgi:hypothetical protein